MRVTVYEFYHKETISKIILLPMFHIGEERYYNVTWRK